MAIERETVQRNCPLPALTTRSVARRDPLATENFHITRNPTRPVGGKGQGEA